MDYQCYQKNKKKKKKNHVQVKFLTDEKVVNFEQKAAPILKNYLN